MRCWNAIVADDLQKIQAGRSRILTGHVDGVTGHHLAFQARLGDGQDLTGMDADAHLEGEAVERFQGPVQIGQALLHPERGHERPGGSSSCATGTPNTTITASPMNFSTVPPGVRFPGASRRRTRRSPPHMFRCSRRPSRPTRSANRTVTSFRSSPGGAGGGTLVPEAGQNRASCGRSTPHDSHLSASEDPHSTQKRASSGFSAPQTRQRLTA